MIAKIAGIGRDKEKCRSEVHRSPVAFVYPSGQYFLGWIVSVCGGVGGRRWQQSRSE